MTVIGEPIQVCKQAFVSMHGITRFRLDKALTKITATGIPMPDLRGKHDAHPHINENRIRLANSHIASFPTTSSHYSRKNTPNSKYLESTVKNKKHLYDLYKTWLKDNYPTEDPVAQHFYLNILTKYFPHLRFRKLRKDTCNTCDSYKIQVNDPGRGVEAKNAAEASHQEHLIKAEAGYNLPKQLLILKPNATIVCMDLQQALTTPKLTVNIAFYKRKMNTYNFNIHNYRDNKGYMFLWDETTAKRGAIEIISNVDFFINNYVSNDTRELIFFSDNCSGQNKNYFLTSYYLYLIHKGRFDEISHIYFQVGHTYMAADGDFGLIEKNVSQQMHIYTPDEYAYIIRNCRETEDSRFIVNVMQQKDYKDWEIISKETTRRKGSINYSKCCYFRFSKNYKFGYGCGDSYLKYMEHSDEKISMVKGRGISAEISFDLSNLQITQKYTSPIPLSPEKQADLLVLTSEWVPPAWKRLYWDRVLSIQGNESCNAASTGHDQLGASAVIEEHSDNDNVNNMTDDHETDDTETDDPLLGAHFFDYD